MGERRIHISHIALWIGSNNTTQMKIPWIYPWRDEETNINQRLCKTTGTWACEYVSSKVHEWKARKHIFQVKGPVRSRSLFTSQNTKMIWNMLIQNFMQLNILFNSSPVLFTLKLGNTSRAHYVNKQLYICIWFLDFLYPTTKYTFENYCDLAMHRTCKSNSVLAYHIQNCFF